jgi:GAF domain-containing protein
LVLASQAEVPSGEEKVMPREHSRLTYLETLRDVAQGLSDVAHEPGVLDLLLKQVTAVMPVERVLVRLLSPWSDELVLAASAGIPDDSLLRKPAPIAASPLHRRAVGGEVVVLEELTRAEDFPYRDAARREGLNGVAAAPMRLRGRTIGIFEVYCADVKALAPEDLLLLDTIADLGALALEKLRLHQSLYHIAAALNGSLDLEPMLRQVLEATVKEMWLKGGAIRLLEPNEQVLRLVASHGLSETYLSKGDVHAAESGFDQRVLRGEAVVLYDVEREPGLEYREEMTREGIRSVLVVPIRLKDDRIVGLVRVYSAHSRQFGSVATAYLTSVADLVAVAIERAQLYRKLKASYEDLKLDLVEWHRFLALG